MSSSTSRRLVFLRSALLAFLLRVVPAPSFSKLLTPALRLSTSLFLLIPRAPLALSILALRHDAPSSFVALGVVGACRTEQHCDHHQGHADHQQGPVIHEAGDRAVPVSHEDHASDARRVKRT